MSFERAGSETSYGAIYDAATGLPSLVALPDGNLALFWAVLTARYTTGFGSRLEFETDFNNVDLTQQGVPVGGSSGFGLSGVSNQIRSIGFATTTGGALYAVIDQYYFDGRSVPGYGVTFEMADDGNGSGGFGLSLAAVLPSDPTPSIAALTNDTLAVAWNNSGDTVTIETLDAHGQTLATHNTMLSSGSLATNLLALGNGGFVLGTRTDIGIQAQIYDASVIAQGAAFTIADANAYDVSLRLLAGGNLLAVSLDWNGGAPLIEAGIFTTTGAAVGTPVTIDPGVGGFGGLETLGGAVQAVSSAALTNGDFVVTWATSTFSGDASPSGLPAGASTAIHAELFDASGNAIGNSFLVNSITAGFQVAPSVTALSSGGFAITWDETSGNTPHAAGTIETQFYSEMSPIVASGAGSLSGTAGNDVMIASTMGNTLMGLAGDDQLVGGAAPDTLIGGTGHDTLTGHDSATALNAPDTFEGTLADLAGDIITDLRLGDRIEITDAAYADFRYNRDGLTLSLAGDDDVTIGNGLNPHFVLVADGAGADLVAAPHEASINDFNGDGHSDILWQNANGQITAWTVAGNGTGDRLTPNTYVTSANGPDFRIDESLDFNGDGHSDYVVCENDGTFLIETSAAGGASFRLGYQDSTVAPVWSLAAVGDLNGDGKDDLVWHNAISGELTTWQSTGTGFTQNVAVYTGIPTDWQVVGAGDFNADGMADLLWRNQSTGVFTTWNSNGQAFDTNVYTNTSVDLGWHVQGIADFNGDGKDDLLWRNTASGEFTVWTSTGTGFTPNTYVDTTVGPDWQIAQTGDFNDDGKADILWRNTVTGEFTTWQSNGHGFDENVVVNTSVDPSWHVQGHDFLFG